MKIVLAIFLFLHGFSHSVGFFVSWKISKLDNQPYKTTILYNRIDLKYFGIRIWGIIWLLISLTMILFGIVVLRDFYSFNYLLILTGISMFFCILALPDTRIGILANILLFLFVFMNSRYDWLPG